MNYAWANPSTGAREQTELSTPERMLAEARRQVWEELQGPNASDFDRHCVVYRQEPIGKVNLDGPSIDRTKAVAHPSEYFAWADPESGRRIVSEEFPGQALVQQLKRQQENRQLVHPDAYVTIYATWPECTVSRSDPPPEIPEPLEAPQVDSHPEREASEIDRRKARLDAVTILDEGQEVALQTAWALLDIAENARFIAGSLQKPKARPQMSLWKRFRRWVWGDPLELRDIPPGPDWSQMAAKSLYTDERYRFGVPLEYSPDYHPETESEKRSRIVRERNQEGE